MVGTRPIRHDGLEKVNGVAKYGADIQIAGLLHGKSEAPMPTHVFAPSTPARLRHCLE